jgi:hypothetical protein
MLLVNERGVVTNVWEGKLDSERQAQMLAALLGAWPEVSAGMAGQAYGTSR